MRKQFLEEAPLAEGGYDEVEQLGTRYGFGRVERHVGDAGVPAAPDAGKADHPALADHVQPLAKLGQLTEDHLVAGQREVGRHAVAAVAPAEDRDRLAGRLSHSSHGLFPQKSCISLLPTTKIGPPACARAHPPSPALTHARIRSQLGQLPSRGAPGSPQTEACGSKLNGVRTDTVAPALAEGGDARPRRRRSGCSHTSCTCALASRTQRPPCAQRRARSPAPKSRRGTGAQRSAPLKRGRHIARDDRRLTFALYQISAPRVGRYRQLWWLLRFRRRGGRTTQGPSLLRRHPSRRPPHYEVSGRLSADRPLPLSRAGLVPMPRSRRCRSRWRPSSGPAPPARPRSRAGRGSSGSRTR
jgi:hypothetical protein